MSTNKPSVVTRKDCSGNWFSESRVVVVPLLELHIDTRKVSSGLLVSSATIHHEEEGSLVHVMFQDYSRRLIQRKLGRCTAKAVEAQHNEALTMLEAVRIAVREQYGLRGVAHPESPALKAESVGVL